MPDTSIIDRHIDIEYSFGEYYEVREDISLFLTKRGDVIERIDNHEESEGSELISFTLGESDKRMLTLGVVMAVQELEEAVAAFNRYSSEYQVEIAGYYRRAGNYEDAREQLNLDVITGKAPDIITMSGGDSSLFSKKGLLADLYDFMREDEECSKDMFMLSVLRAYEEDGHLYSISPSFLLHSMWGYGDVTGGRSVYRISRGGGKRYGHCFPGQRCGRQCQEGRTVGSVGVRKVLSAAGL